MLLGYNTNGLAHHRLEDAIHLLHDEGFQAIAITADVAHLDPFRVSAAEVTRVAELLRTTRLTSVVETGARYVLDPARKHRPNLLEDDPGERAVRIDFLRRCIDLAAALGSVAVSLWAGAVPEGVSPETASDRLAAGLATLLPAAEAAGVPLALEPEPGMLIETVAEGLRVLDRLGAPNLGLTVDVGHLYVTGEGPVPAVLETARGRVLQVHAEDIRAGIHEHLPPGEGDVDFPEIWESLDAIGYAGPVCFELSRSSHAAPEMLRRARAAFEHRKR